MKQRKGFVSNSSSTSFIIAIKQMDSNKCKFCGRSDPEFLTLFKGQETFNSTGIRHESVEGILEEQLEWCNPDDKTFKELKTKLKKAESEGMKVVEVNISNHDCHIMNLLNEFVEKGYVTILEEEDR